MNATAITQAAATKRADELTAKLTAFNSFADLIAAVAQGYSPTLRRPGAEHELASHIDLAAHAQGIRTRTWRGGTPAEAPLSVARQIAEYDADLYRAKRDARVAKKMRGSL